MTGVNRPRWRLWGVLPVLVGWSVLLALAIVTRLRRLARPAEAAPPPPVAVLRPLRSQQSLAATASPIPAQVRRESGEVNARSVFAVVFGWFVFVFVGLGFLMHAYESAGPYPKPPLDSNYPPPRLILHPFALQPSYLSAQRRALDTGALPISRAMVAIAGRPDPYAPVASEPAHER